jgi:hypothetical protein
MVHASSPSTWETEAGGLRVQGQPGLHSDTLSQGKTYNQKEKKKEREEILYYYYYM